MRRGCGGGRPSSSLFVDGENPSSAAWADGGEQVADLVAGVAVGGETGKSSAVAGCRSRGRGPSGRCAVKTRVPCGGGSGGAGGFWGLGWAGGLGGGRGARGGGGGAGGGGGGWGGTGREVAQGPGSCTRPRGSARWTGWNVETLARVLDEAAPRGIRAEQTRAPSRPRASSRGDRTAADAGERGFRRERRSEEVRS